MLRMLILCSAATGVVAAPVGSGKTEVIVRVDETTSTTLDMAQPDSTPMSTTPPNFSQTTSNSTTPKLNSTIPLSTTHQPVTGGRRPEKKVAAQTWLERNMLSVAAGSAAALFVVVAVVSGRAVAKPKLRLTESNLLVDQDEPVMNGHCTSPLLETPGVEPVYE
mmetsp:Transcript_88511/g.122836  ORF Transcript_88511/g.122836 Transcript_88511/m.122836 type:complete len:164 (+) Transcript_88511:242-733(+)